MAIVYKPMRLRVNAVASEDEDFEDEEPRYEDSGDPQMCIPAVVVVPDKFPLLKGGKKRKATLKKEPDKKPTFKRLTPQKLNDSSEDSNSDVEIEEIPRRTNPNISIPIEDLAFYNIAKELTNEILYEICFDVHRAQKIGYYPEHLSVPRDGPFDIMDDSFLEKVKESVKVPLKYSEKLVLPKCTNNIIDDNYLEEVKEKVKMPLKDSERLVIQPKCTNSTKSIKCTYSTRCVTKNKQGHLRAIHGLMGHLSSMTMLKCEKRTRKPSEKPSKTSTATATNRIILKPNRIKYPIVPTTLTQYTLKELFSILSDENTRTLDYKSLEKMLEESQILDADGLKILSKSTSGKYCYLDKKTMKVLIEFVSAWKEPFNEDKLKLLKRNTTGDYCVQKPLDSKTFEEARKLLTSSEIPLDHLRMLSFKTSSDAEKLDFRTMESLYDHTDCWEKPLTLDTINAIEKATKTEYLPLDEKTFDILVEHCGECGVLPFDSGIFKTLMLHVETLKKPLDLDTLMCIAPVWIEKYEDFESMRQQKPSHKGKDKKKKPPLQSVNDNPKQPAAKVVKKNNNKRKYKNTNSSYSGNCNKEHNKIKNGLKRSLPLKMEHNEMNKAPLHVKVSKKNFFKKIKEFKYTNSNYSENKEKECNKGKLKCLKTTNNYCNSKENKHPEQQTVKVNCVNRKRKYTDMNSSHSEPNERQEKGDKFRTLKKSKRQKKDFSGSLDVKGKHENPLKIIKSKPNNANIVSNSKAKKMERSKEKIPVKNARQQPRVDAKGNNICYISPCEITIKDLKIALEKQETNARNSIVSEAKIENKFSSVLRNISVTDSEVAVASTSTDKRYFCPDVDFDASTGGVLELKKSLNKNPMITDETNKKPLKLKKINESNVKSMTDSKEYRLKKDGPLLKDTGMNTGRSHKKKHKKQTTLVNFKKLYDAETKYNTKSQVRKQTIENNQETSNKSKCARKSMKKGLPKSKAVKEKSSSKEILEKNKNTSDKSTTHDKLVKKGMHDEGTIELNQETSNKRTIPEKSVKKGMHDDENIVLNQETSNKSTTPRKSMETKSKIDEETIGKNQESSKKGKSFETSMKKGTSKSKIGRETIGKNNEAINKSVMLENSVLKCTLKNDNDKQTIDKNQGTSNRRNFELNKKSSNENTNLTKSMETKSKNDEETIEKNQELSYESKSDEVSDRRFKRQLDYAISKSLELERKKGLKRPLKESSSKGRSSNKKPSNERSSKKVHQKKGMSKERHDNAQKTVKFKLCDWTYFKDIQVTSIKAPRSDESQSSADE